MSWALRLCSRGGTVAPAARLLMRAGASPVTAAGSSGFCEACGEATASPEQVLGCPGFPAAGVTGVGGFALL